MSFYSAARFLKPYLVCNSCLDTANYIVPPKHKNLSKLLRFLILPSVQTNRGLAQSALYKNNSCYAAFHLVGTCFTYIGK